MSGFSIAVGRARAGRSERRNARNDAASLPSTRSPCRRAARARSRPTCWSSPGPSLRRTEWSPCSCSPVSGFSVIGPSKGGSDVALLIITTAAAPACWPKIARATRAQTPRCTTTILPATPAATYSAGSQPRLTLPVASSERPPFTVERRDASRAIVRVDRRRWSWRPVPIARREARRPQCDRRLPSRSRRPRCPSCWHPVNRGCTRCRRHCPPPKRPRRRPSTALSARDGIRAVAGAEVGAERHVDDVHVVVDGPFDGLGRRHRSIRRSRTRARHRGRPSARRPDRSERCCCVRELIVRPGVRRCRSRARRSPPRCLRRAAVSVAVERIRIGIRHVEAGVHWRRSRHRPDRCRP